MIKYPDSLIEKAFRALDNTFELNYDEPDIVGFNDYYCPRSKPLMPRKYDPWKKDGNMWETEILTYQPVVYPFMTTDKETGERTESMSFDVPGLEAKDITVSWDKDSRTLTVIGNNKKLGRSYTYTLNTFSKDLLEETLTTTVVNGVATVSGKLKKIEPPPEKKEENNSSIIKVPVK